MVLELGCGRLPHTTAGQVGRPVVVDAISRRGILWQHHRASTANLTGQTALWQEWSTVDGLSWCLQLWSSFLHGSPFFVVPQQKPGLRWSISQTKKGFQDSIVDIVSGAKAENNRMGVDNEQYLQSSNPSFICHRHGRIYRHRLVAADMEVFP